VLKASGCVEIPIKRPLRIRLILEDIDTFHEGGAEKETYFGSLMIDEFLHPLDFKATERDSQKTIKNPQTNP
jgi:hypothetical protein